MPLHDWSKVRAGKFHHFHQAWIYRISDRLNDGRLPDGLYAAGEQVAGQVGPDELALEHNPKEAGSSNWQDCESVVAVAQRPPQVSQVVEAESQVYARKQEHLVIRSTDGDSIVAIIEIVSPGNKDSRSRLDQFLLKSASALDAGYNLLVIDVHPPGPLDPEGIHGAIWKYAAGDDPDWDCQGNGTLVAYRAEPVITALIEPAILSNPLPDMPLFLDVGCYVNVPLEAAYDDAFKHFPRPWKDDLAA